MPKILKRLSEHPLQELCITFSGLRHKNIFLGRILTLCPNLRKIHLESLDFSSNLGQNYFMSEEMLKVRSSVAEMTLKGLCINQVTLEDILEQHGRHLRRLCIIDACRIPNAGPQNQDFSAVTRFDRASFCQAVRRASPDLESFHFSFFKGDEQYNALKIVMDTFPHLKELGITTGDLLLDHAQFPLYLLQLTRLEIYSQVAVTDTASRNLHAFLCNAPNLRHLIAPGFNFKTSLLAVGEKARLWSCEGLRTLHLGFDDSTSQLEFTSAARNRLICGYLVRACPRMEDLAITHIPLSLQKEGGLCLLSRLGSLQRLWVCSSSILNVDKVYLEWLGAGKEQANTSSLLAGLDFGVMGQQCGIEYEPSRPVDFRQMGMLQDVQDCYKALAALGRKEGEKLECNPVWPMLVLFGMRFPEEKPMLVKGRLPLLREIITRHRPGVQVDLQYL
ncbi:hypothetical protein BGZ94_009416 [Podila epigama]|nr:hypothetical protein BGZ94_009416 [Podila epigama]